MKRIIAFLLSVAMVFSIVMPSVGAAYESSGEGSASMSSQESYAEASSSLAAQSSASEQSVSDEEASSGGGDASAKKDSGKADSSVSASSSAKGDRSAEKDSGRADSSASASSSAKGDQSAEKDSGKTDSSASASSSAKGDQSAEKDPGRADSSASASSSAKGDQSAEKDPGRADSSASASSSAKGDQSAQTAESSADVSEGDASLPAPQSRTLTRTLKCVDGVRYTLTLTYDDAAGIPDDAKLSVVELNRRLTEEEMQLEENKKRPYSTETFLSEEELDQESFDLRAGLKVKSRDYVLFTKFLDISLTANGEVLQPKAPVIVTLETDVVDESASDALELACYDEKATQDWQKELEKLRKEREARIKAGKVVEVEKRQKAKVFTVLACVNETREKEGVKLSFQTQELTRLGVAGLAKELKTWRVKDETVSVYGPRRLKAKVRSESMKQPNAGLEKVHAFSVKPTGADVPEYDVTFWVGTNQERYRREQADAGSADPDEEEAESGLTACQLKNGKAGSELIGPQSAAAPVAIESGEQVGLLWDTGLREQSIGDRNVTLEGMMPKSAQVEAKDVLEQCANPEELNKDAGEGAQTVAAYDITISGRDGEFQPADGETVSVTIENVRVSQSDNVEVWHLLDNGEVEVLRDVTVQNNAVSFDAGSFSVYMVVQITKEQILTASDGNQYKITVTYDSDAGIPEDAELSVSELKEGKKYNKYVKKAAKALGRKQEHLAFAHAFDIKLVNPETGEHYQPTKPVAVSIELYKEDIQEGDNVNVVHFPDSYAGQRGPYPGNPTEGEILGVNIRGEAVEFESSGFSVYVVTSDALLKHFVFLNGNDSMNDVFAEQVLVDGESLVEPAMPTKSGAVFDHWELVTDWSSRTETVSGQEVIHYTATESETFAFTSYQPYRMSDADKALTQEALDQHANKVYFRAIYGASKTVISYYNQSGLVVQKNEIEKPAAGEAAKVIDTRAVSYLPIQDKEGSVLIFKYWTDDPRGAGKEVGVVSDGAGGWDETNAGKISITSTSPDEIILYPALDDGHYLHFDANKKPYDIASADFIPAETVLNGTNAAGVCAALNARANHGIPTTTGYTFAGWYISASKAKFEANELTAVFKPNAAGTALEVVTYNDNGTEKPVYNKLLDSYGNLPNNPTLYAHWTKSGTATYTVVIWKQKLNAAQTNVMDPNSNDSYAFVESFPMPAVSTANAVTLGADYQNLNVLANYNNVHPDISDNKTENPYYGFTLNAAKTQTSAEVKPDGSTVLNVYYVREQHTLTFYTQYHPTTASSSTYPTQYGYYKSGGSTGYYQIYYRNGEWRKNNRNSADIYSGRRYYRSASIESVYTINAPYGAKISHLFEPNGIVGTDGSTYSEERWKDQVTLSVAINSSAPYVEYKEVIAKLFTMPNNDIKFMSSPTTNGYKHLHYYAEVLPGETKDKSFNNVDYKEFDFSPIDIKYGWVTYDEDYYEFAGFNRAGSDPAFGDDGTALKTGDQDTIHFYYTRKSHDIQFLDSQGGGAISGISAAHVKFGYPITDYNTAAGYSPTKTGYRFNGWYLDQNCKIRVFFADNQAYQNYAEEKALLTTIPDEEIRLYAGWSKIKNRAILIPNGGDMGGQGVQFHLDDGEKVQPADPTRDFIPVELKFELADPAHTGDFNLVNGNPVYCPDSDGDYVLASGGAYEYDPVNGAYLQTEHGEGSYSAKAGAYTFMGWYEAELNTTGEEKLIVEYKANKYTYAWGHYKDVGAGNGSYSLEGTEYRFVGDGNGRYNFINAQPQTDGDGQYVVKRDNNGRMMKFDTETAPIEPVTLVALWQRAGDYRVVYDVKDPALNLPASAYIGVTAPEDQEEYIDDSHAIVLPAIGAPKGYKLDAWVDKQNREWKPNELVPVNERNADVKGNEMIVTLHAKYSVFDPSERNMADYRFMINTKKENGALVFGSDYTEYELQRIAVNEELKAPITPEAPEGYAFKGWYYDTKGTSIFNGFGVIANPVYTTLYAVFVKVYNVSYYLTDSADMEPTNTVIATQTYRKPDTTAGETYERLDTRHINHPVDADHYVVEWQAFTGFGANGKPDVHTAGTKYAYNTLSTATVESDLKLYAVLRARSYLSFDSCGGSFVEQVEIPHGSWPARPKDPTRPGFFFDGWFTKEVGGVEYEFDKKLTELKGSGSGQDPDFNTDAPKLYAHWSPNPNSTEKGKYTVIWWAQTETGGLDYEYQKSQTYEGYVGRTVDITSAEWIAANGDPCSLSNLTNYYNTDSTKDLSKYFEYTPANGSVTYGRASEVSKEIEENGATVFNVRFHRDRYTFRFNTKNDSTNYGKVHWQGHTYSRLESAPYDYYKFETWLGAPIADQWPIVSAERQGLTGEPKPWVEMTGNYKFRYWEGPSSSGNRATLVSIAEADMLSAATNKVVTFTLYRQSTDNESTVHYYFDGVENPLYRQTLYSSYTPTTEGGVTYTSTLNSKEFEGYEVITSPDMALTEGPTAGKYNPIVDGNAKALYESRTLSAGSMENYDYYIYTQNDTGYDYYYWDSGLFGLMGHYRPVTVSIAGNGQKDAYTIYYNDGSDHALTTGKISYVPHGEAAPSGNVFDTLPNWEISTFKALAIHEEIEVRQRPITSSETQIHLSFYYRVKQYHLILKMKESDTGNYQDLSVNYGTPIPEVLAGVTDPTSTNPAMTFNCWSLTTAAPEPYTGTMPAHDIVLYATWKPVQFTVTTLGVDENGVGFLCDDEGKEVDAAGNLVANGKVSAVYENVDYGTELRSVGIVDNPKMDKRLFKGWLNATTNTSVTGVYKVVTNLTIKPQWTSLDTRKIQYLDNLPDFTDETTYDTTKYASFASQGKTAPAAPTDPNAYVLGAKVTIHDSNGLYVYRKDVDGQIYKADFAFWEDSEGNRYYPNTTYVFREDNPGITEIGGIQTLVLKAVYSEYRETILLYDKNADDAQFVIQGTENETPPTPYTNKVVQAGEADAGRVRVLYRDWLNEHWASSFQHKPNDEFPIGEDEDYVTYTGSGLNPYAFTVIRSDSLGNEYIFAGWTDETGGRDASLPIAQNGDKAYVNTIKDGGVLKNILYAVWGICKVVDNGEEHVFDTIQKAVDYVSNHMSGKTGTIEMLIDYKMDSTRTVNIPSGCTVTLTTAHSGTYQYSGTGNATITRGNNGNSLFTVNGGSLTVENITLDGNKGNYTCFIDGGLLRLDQGTLHVTTGTVLCNSRSTNHGGAVHATGTNATKTLTIDGNAQIKHCEAGNCGGAVHIYANSTASIEGNVQITGCTAGNYGGGMFCHGSTMAVKDNVKITGCTATKRGGGLNVGWGGTLNVGQSSGDNVIIENCSAAYGGGINVEDDTNGDNTLNLDGKVTIKNCNATDGNGGGIHFEDDAACTTSGTVTIQDCRAVGNADNKALGGGVYLGTGSATTISGLTIKGHESLAENTKNAKKGGGIYSERNLTLSAPTIQSCSSNEQGGGVYLTPGAALTVNGGGFTSNTAVSDGGAIYGHSEKEAGAQDYTGASITTNGTNFTSNASTNRSGGAISASTKSTVSVTGGTFTDNSAKTDGGAINLSENYNSENNQKQGESTLTVSDTTFSNNTATNNGGAIRICEATTAKVTSCTFTGNSATTKQGGAILALSKAAAPSKLTIDGGTFTGNRAGTDGGAVRIGAGGTMTVKGDVTMGGTGTAANTAKKGGALAAAGTIDLHSGSITGNTATEKGSAVYIEDNATLNMSGGSITGNTVSDSVGAVEVGGTGAKLNFSGSPVVYDNSYEVTQSNGLNTTQQKNVVLSGSGDDVNGIINVTDALTAPVAATGSAPAVPGATIGVYDATTDQNHQKPGELFGSHISNVAGDFSVFKNDLDAGLYGMKDPRNAGKLCWCYGTIEIHKIWKLLDLDGYRNHPDRVTVEVIRLSTNQTVQTLDIDNTDTIDYISPDTNKHYECWKATAKPLVPGDTYMVKETKVGTVDTNSANCVYSVTYSSNSVAVEPGQNHKLEVTNTNTLIPILIQKKWDQNIPEAVRKKIASVSLQVSGVLNSTETPVPCFIGNWPESPNLSALPYVEAGATPPADSWQEYTWEEVGYVPKFNPSGTAFASYSIQEQSGFDTANGTGVWKCVPAYTQGQTPLNANWSDIKDPENYTDMYIRLHARHTDLNETNRLRYQKIHRFEFYFRDKRNGKLYFTSADFGDTSYDLNRGSLAARQGAKQEYFYIKVRMPRNIDPNNIELLNRADTTGIHLHTDDANCRLAYGILTYNIPGNKNKPTGAPDFQQGIVDRSLNESMTSGVKFDQIGFDNESSVLTNQEVGKEDYYKIDTQTKCLKVYVPSQLSLTNSLDAIARVRNKPANSSWSDWSYYGALIDIKSGNTVTTAGAFNYANTLTGEVEIETLRESAEFDGTDRYTLTSGFTFNKTGITKLTLRTTQDSLWNSGTTKFRSTIKRGYSGTSLITVNRNTAECIVTDMIFDGNSNNNFTATGTGQTAGGLVNVSAAASLMVRNATFQNSTAESGNGAGLYTNSSVGNVSVNDTTFDNCRITGTGSGNSGGGAYFAGKATANCVTVTDCHADGDKGGGIYFYGADSSLGCTYTYTDDNGDHTVTKSSTFTNCTASRGGGLHFFDTGGSVTGTAANTVQFSSCVSNGTGNDHYGGGLAFVQEGTVSYATFSSCSASKNGGGLGLNAGGTVSHVTITGCSAEKGGGIYSNGNLTMVATSVTGNSLTNATAENAAGVYLVNDKQLTLGDDSSTAETSTVYDNHTSDNSTASNLRLSETSNMNSKNALSVKNTLAESCKIRVTNAKFIYVQFGSADASCKAQAPLKVYSDDAQETVNEAKNIAADDEKLIARIDPRTSENPNADRIYWWGQPVCKITDKDDNLLTLKNGQPAVYGALSLAFTDYTQTGAFQSGSAPPAKIKMLVAEYQLEELGNKGTQYIPKAEFELSSASINDTDKFPGVFDENNLTTRSVIKRGTETYKHTMFRLSDAKQKITIKNLVIDGSNYNPSEHLASTESGKDGWLFRVEASGQLTLDDGAELRNCYSNEGGAVFCQNGGKLTMKGTSEIHDCHAKNGGGVFTKGGNNASFTMEGSAKIYNCEAKEKGGGVSIGDGNTAASFTMKGNASIKGCTAQTGAGIYVAQGAGLLKLSGSPDFGGTGTDEDQNLVATTTVTLSDNSTQTVPAGNFVTMADEAIFKYTTVEENKPKNGKKPYLTIPTEEKYRVRQDIFIAGFDNNDTANSVYVTDKLTGDPGTIWVWAEHQKHYEVDKQFAQFYGDGTRLSAADKDASMKVFRNARADAETKNPLTSEELAYLFGVAGTGNNINWGALVDGSQKVILKKVDQNTKTPLKGAVFTVYKKDQSTVVSVKNPEGTTPAEEELRDKTSGTSGVFWIGDLPYGTYYLHETEPVDKWFYFVLDENFQIMSTAYDSDTGAKTAGDAETTAVSWASKIISGKKTFNDLPDDAALKNRVKTLLTDSGHGDKVPST